MCTQLLCTGEGLSCSNTRDYALRHELTNGASITSIVNHLPLMMPQMASYLRRFVEREGFTHILFMMAHTSDFHVRKGLDNPQQLACLNYTRNEYGDLHEGLAATHQHERLWFEPTETSEGNPIRVRVNQGQHLWPSEWDYGGDEQYCRDPGRWLAGLASRNVTYNRTLLQHTLATGCRTKNIYPRPVFAHFASSRGQRVLEVLPWFAPNSPWWDHGRSSPNGMDGMDQQGNMRHSSPRFDILPTYDLLVTNGWRCESRGCNQTHQKWPSHECFAGSPVFLAQRVHRLLFGPA